jgi:hypothetical protein
MARYRLTPMFAFRCDNAACKDCGQSTWLAANEFARMGRPQCICCSENMVLVDPTITIVTHLEHVGQCLATQPQPRMIDAIKITVN